MRVRRYFGQKRCQGRQPVRVAKQDFEREVAEAQIRITVMNGYTALGIPITEAVG